MICFHAGGWITASRLFPNYFSPWQLELAARHSALLVTPEYRMLLESSLDELIQDIEDFCQGSYKNNRVARWRWTFLVSSPQARVQAVS